MDFVNQQEALQQLHSYAEIKRQAILIHGTKGCGKSYLAQQYSKMLGIPDFRMIETKVGTIRETLDACFTITNPVVLCIENLDQAVSGASYTMLKFLEEPKSNIYLVVTCRNIRQIPDTIESRCVSISVPPIVESDLLAYAKTQEESAISRIQADTKLWRCVKSTLDIDTLIKLNPEQIQYFQSLCGFISPTESISSIVWRLQKFPDNIPTPIDIVVRYLMNANTTWRRACIDCLDALESGRLGNHAVISKLVFELKYGDW